MASSETSRASGGEQGGRERPSQAGDPLTVASRPAHSPGIPGSAKVAFRQIETNYAECAFDSECRKSLEGHHGTSRGSSGAGTGGCAESAVLAVVLAAP